MATGIECTMTSSFTWLDYSERERRAMLDVVDLFREQDTRDELALAIVGAFRSALPGHGVVEDPGAVLPVHPVGLLGA